MAVGSGGGETSSLVRPGIQHLHGQQAVEGIRIFCRDPILFGRGGFIAAGVSDAPKPISSLCAAQGSIGCRGHVLEVFLGETRLLQVAECDPSRHERLLFSWIDGQRTGIFDEIIGELHVAELKRAISEFPAFRPPFIDRGDFVGVGRYGEDDLSRVFDLPGLAQKLFFVKREARIVSAAGGKGVYQRLRVRSLVEYGQTCRGLLLLARRQKRNETLRKRDAIRAISCITDVIGHQPVETPFVIGWREKRAEAVEKAILQRRRNSHLAPRLGGEPVGFLFIAVRKIG